MTDCGFPVVKIDKQCEHVGGLDKVCRNDILLYKTIGNVILHVYLFRSVCVCANMQLKLSI